MTLKPTVVAFSDTMRRMEENVEFVGILGMRVVPGRLGVGFDFNLIIGTQDLSFRAFYLLLSLLVL